jgi:hypothetical protein
MHSAGMILPCYLPCGISGTLECEPGNPRHGEEHIMKNLALAFLLASSAMAVVSITTSHTPRPVGDINAQTLAVGCCDDPPPPCFPAGPPCDGQR